MGQGHQRFTPEYVIKNQTKPHLRNYSFLHSHFLTSSQTKLLIPWTFFNVQYIIRYSEDSRKAMSRRRHRGFGSLHATALASKMRQQSDWTWKNYLFNIDCRWLGPVSVYLQTRISCFTRLPIISSLSTGCSLTQDMGRDWHQHIPCLVMPIFYSQGYIYSENLYDLSNPQCSFPPGYHHGLCSQNKLPRLRSSSQSTLRSLHLTLHDGTSIRLPSTRRGSIDVFW